MGGEEAADPEVSSAATAPAGKTPLPEFIHTPGRGGSEPKAWAGLTTRAPPSGAERDAQNIHSGPRSPTWPRSGLARISAATRAVFYRHIRLVARLADLGYGPTRSYSA